MTAERYVQTEPLKQAGRGHEMAVLTALGIAWQDGAQHISCPSQINGALDRELSMAAAHLLEHEEVAQ